MALWKAAGREIVIRLTEGAKTKERFGGLQPAE